MAEATIDPNATTAIEDVTQASKELLTQFDQSLFQQIQPLINKIYASHYGRYLADTVFGIPLGNLIVAFLVFLTVVLLRNYLSKVVTRFLLSLAKKTQSQLDDITVEQLYHPLRFLFIIIALDLFFQFAFLINDTTEILINTLLIIDIYWILYAFTPALQHLLVDYSHHNQHLSYELSRFIIRLVRTLILLLALISLLYNFGINVTAFVASLGLVGMAFALAAKDTAANLFGSIALMLDQSIRIGEWIKVNGVEGIVEDIGMRTTKIRTFEKSIVVVPNSIVANTNIENYSRRNIRRIKMVLGLTYDTTPEQMQKILKALRRLLATHPGIAQDQTTLVRFDRFEDSYLGIFIYTFTNTADWDQYLATREDVQLKMMEIVQEHGAQFAFPSQSIYVEKLPDSLQNREIR